jgi:hypothetical protein
MLINKYIKSRKYLFTTILISIIILLLFNPKKNIKTDKENFSIYLRNELIENNLELVEFQNIKFNYSFTYRRIFFIAKKNGLKDLFKAYIRTTKKGKIIAIKDITRITDTPLSDEEFVYSNNKLLIYRNNYMENEVVSIIEGDKITHIIIKDSNINNIEFKDGLLIINNNYYDIKKLKSYKKIGVYVESFKKGKNKHYNNLNKLLKKYNWSNSYKYIKDSAISNDEDLPFKYLKIEIPKKNDFEIFFFNKKEYTLKVVDSGGVNYTKTGVIYKNDSNINKSIYMDITLKAGFKIKKDLIRPIIQNYPTIKINGKNNVTYGFLNKISENTDFILQFGYPLIFKGKKEVEIENLKNNLKKDSQKNKKRTGICFKGDSIGYFNLFGNRNLLIDYLYLIDCDYGVETHTSNITTEKIKNYKPKLALTPKNQKSKNLYFKNYKFLEKYEDDLLRIYKISCGNLNLFYKFGKSDPIINKKLNISSNFNQNISIHLGSIDVINPDGLYSYGEVYPQRENKDAFIISKSECKIDSKLEKNDALFYKEGKLIFKDGTKYDVLNEKYHNILTAIGIKNDDIYIYEFKNPTDYKKIFLYLDKITPDKIISFENYGGSFDENSGKLIIEYLRNGKEISPIDN